MVTFLHTADTHLGCSLSYLNEDFLKNYEQARFDVVKQMARTAKNANYDFVIVAGDFFENNQVGDKVILRAAEVLNEFYPKKVYVMPANHDPYEPGSPYSRPFFTSKLKEHVTIMKYGEVYLESGNVEIIGATWDSKRPGYDPLTKLLSELQPVATDKIRIVVGHGTLNRFTMGNPSDFEESVLKQAASERKFHYLALGDRHSANKILDNCWYSGTPEPIAFEEENPGKALEVKLDANSCKVRELEMGLWTFVKKTIDLQKDSALSQFNNELDIKDKEKTLVRATLSGTISFSEKLELEKKIREFEGLFASIEIIGFNNLTVIKNDADLDNMNLSGFADKLWQQLLAQSNNKEEHAERALNMLYGWLKEDKQ